MPPRTDLGGHSWSASGLPRNTPRRTPATMRLCSRDWPRPSIACGPGALTSWCGWATQTRSPCDSRSKPPSLFVIGATFAPSSNGGHGWRPAPGSVFWRSKATFSFRSRWPRVKREIAARTFRPKLLRSAARFLRPLPRQHLVHSLRRFDVGDRLDLSNVDRLLARLRIDSSVPPVTRFRGGYTEARRHLRQFLANHLKGYAAARAHPAEPAISTLSPYLHFGQISVVEVALAVDAISAAAEDRTSYLDELLVRRELAMNFVQTTPDYDRYDCLPSWARRTLEDHRRDRREHVYNFDQLAGAATHDPYWNAAMRQMLMTGYMHNYMRMYWGKKVFSGRVHLRRAMLSCCV